MARIFLSFLGTNDYVPCHYVIADYQSPLVRFIQLAVIDYLRQLGRLPEQLVFFLTEEAEQRNWQDGFYAGEDGRPCPGLLTCLQQSVPEVQIRTVRVPEGKREAELWEIFNLVYEAILPDSEVFFDITHGFRSLPLLAAVILTYSQVMKQITVGGIYYGAFEILGPAGQVKKLPPEQRLAPIFDLTPLISLADWTLAIDRFLGTGDARKINDLAQKSIKPLLASSRGQDRDAAAIRRVANLLMEFSKNLSTCRGKSFPEIARSLRQALEQFHYPDLIPPFKPLLQRLEKRMEVFQGDEVQDGLKAAAWCQEHNLIQQGLTLLQETLITYFVKQAGGSPGDRVNRELASQAVTIFLEGIPQEKWYPPAHLHPEIIHRHLEFLHHYEGLAKIFRNLSQIRNDINHGGWIEPSRADVLAKKLGDFCQQIAGLLP